MKKIISLILVCFFTIVAYSQNVLYYRATSFAMKYINEYGVWTNWTDWEKSDVTISLDLTNDLIRINSTSPQTYVVVEEVPADYDSSGEQIKFRVIDQDYDYGYVRLRVESNGNCQMYVDFSNIMWVYNIVRYYR